MTADVSIGTKDEVKHRQGGSIPCPHCGEQQPVLGLRRPKLANAPYNIHGMRCPNCLNPVAILTALDGSVHLFRNGPEALASGIES